jgi:glycosyltransferase involved in cell wall biosynthesis
LESILIGQAKKVNGLYVENEMSYQGRVGIQQRVLPAYRAGFFSYLNQSCERGISVFAGEPSKGESIGHTQPMRLNWYVKAKNWGLLHSTAPLYVLWQRGLMRWLEDWDPDVLIVELNPRYLSNLQAIKWMHAKNRPVLGWGLGVPKFAPEHIETAPFSKLLRGWWERFICSCDAIVAYSELGAQQYRDFGFPAQRVFVAPNAVASRPAGPPLPRPPQFDGPPKILFVGRLQFRKRIDNLLYACVRLAPDLQPELWIVGDGPARQEFQSLSEEIYPMAKFLGTVRGESLQPYLAAADLFVLPGTGGLAVQEAMASGLPVIVAEGDGTQADLVQPQRASGVGNGWLVPKNDIGALKRALEEALSDAARLRKMGEVSFRLVEEQFNLENMVAVFVHALTVVGT